MEKRRTVPVKLDVDSADAALLEDTVDEFLWAANYVTHHAFEGEYVTTSKTTLHNDTYEGVETPDKDLVWELVGEAASALQAPFDDVFIRHYDIQFTFDGDELFEAETCRRVLLTDALVDQYATDPEFSLSQLRDAVLAADDIDDEITPVAWGECRDYSQTDDAAIVVGGAAAAPGASASAASCAGAGAGPAAGRCVLTDPAT
ncbi:hypothetical protein [Halobaculum sp. D14]|uniref:hypothetical protein n=1 Tax=Halobaculum sp. D14 TaxID=3421642 RepID=UPI003EBD0101